MITAKTIKSGEPTREQLTMLKQYAAVPDDSRDALLFGLLKRAIKVVQETADKSILPCTMEVTYTDVEPGDIVRLYQTPGKILSVTDANGSPVSYELQGKRITALASSFVVRYETAPDCVEAAELLAVVLQYATALYDGAETATLSNILAQC